MILLHHLRATDFKQFEAVEMAFPASGSVLIEGENESGKSSLFEAVFFALYGDGLNDLKNEALIRYGAAAASVSLTFSVQGRRFEIRRALTRGAAGTVAQGARLTVKMADGTDETVNGVRAVNKQITEELGMSSGALLNTCFVEQKGLEKLESLNTKDREETINELVNLGAFTRIEGLLGKRKDDSDAVTLARRRVDLARLDDVLSGLESRQKHLRTVFAVASLHDIDDKQNQATQEKEEQSIISQRLAAVTALHEKQESVIALRDSSLTAWQNAHADAATKQTAVEDAERIAAQLPKRQEELSFGETLERKLNRLFAIEAEEDRYAAWREANNRATRRVNDAEAALSEAKTNATAAGDLYDAGTRRDALRSWETATIALIKAEKPIEDSRLTALEAQVSESQTALNAAKVAAEVAAASAQKTENAARHAGEIARQEKEAEPNIGIPKRDADTEKVAPPVAVPVVGYAFTGVGVVVAGAGAAMTLAVLIVIGVLLFFVGGFLVFRAVQSRAGEQARYAESARTQASAYETAIADAQNRMEAQVRRRAECDQRIEVIRAAATSAQNVANAANKTVNEITARAATIERALNDRKNEITRLQTGATATAMQQISEAERQLTTLDITPLPKVLPDAASLIARFHAVITAHSFAVTEKLANLKANADKAADTQNAAQVAYENALKAVTSYLPVSVFTTDEKAGLSPVRAELTAAGLPITTEPLKTALQELRSNVAQVKSTSSLLPQLSSATKGAQEKVTASRVTFAANYMQLLTSVSDSAQTLPKGEPLPESINHLEATRFLQDWLEELRAALLSESEFATLAPSERKMKERETTARIGALTQEIDTLREQKTAPRALLEENEATLGESLPSLLTKYPEAMTKTPHEWETTSEDAQRDIEENRTTRKGQAAILGIDESSLDLAIERVALDDAELQRDTNNTARDILTRTRNLILDRVMPRTENFVKRILPLLTDHRYRDIRWIAAENKIQVFDKRKDDYVEKRAFSGGARDQISLALRLAFALATLPTGTSVRPGWLFLDEPLSAFDEKRTRALIDLLTKGFLKEQFPQIFLISHSKSFDAARFPNRIEMVGGTAQPTLAGAGA